MVEKLQTLDEGQKNEVKELMKKYQSSPETLKNWKQLGIKQDTIRNLQVFLKTEGLYQKAIDLNIGEGTQKGIENFLKKDTGIVKQDSTGGIDYTDVVEKKLDLKKVIDEIKARPVLKMLKLNIDKNVGDIDAIKKVYTYLSTQSNEINQDGALKRIADDEGKITIYLRTEKQQGGYASSTKIIDSITIDPKLIIKDGNTNKELDENKFLNQLISKTSKLIDINKNNLKNTVENAQLKILNKIESDFKNSKNAIELGLKNKNWSDEQFAGGLKNMKKFINQATTASATYGNAQRFKEESVFNMKQDLKKTTQQVKNLLIKGIDASIV